jgi:phosphocarrier protein
MITHTITIVNRAGLHTRPAAALVKTAARFQSDFTIIKDQFEINGKSIIGVMTLAAEQGSTLELRFQGPDEEQAAAAVVDLFTRGFDEE